MVIRQNFRGVKTDEQPKGGGNWPLIPEGEYLVVVKLTEETTAKSSGNDMVKVRYMILDEGPCLGKLIFDQIVFCESMAGRNKHVLKVLEQPYEEGADDEDLVIDAEKWVGQKLRVVVIHEEYQGKQKAKVSEYKYRDEETRLKYASKKGKAKPPVNKKDAAPVQEQSSVNESEESEDSGDEETIPF
jgi:hypothetical protein